MRLNLEIRHLVLDHAGPVDMRVLQAQLQAELSARFAAGALPTSGGALERLSVPLPSGGETLGARLGEAVHAIVPPPSGRLRAATRRGAS
ncbi:hypothetical protein [Novosphingobium sp. 9U]|uniref:hypothetical protein n=1 Tax=Novosphingobium sp. 9U TaxID=2653158 RepID=UPI0012F40EA6|nr:hypothetical protein [Novosphingobium sp. 9U]VWX50905.1 hypothetical protein NOVOSPHI9U_350040 [Novosphingobium sp. 9U]